jgi:hypothetical protein
MEVLAKYPKIGAQSTGQAKNEGPPSSGSHFFTGSNDTLYFAKAGAKKLPECHTNNLGKWRGVARE